MGQRRRIFLLSSIYWGHVEHFRGAAVLQMVLRPVFFLGHGDAALLEGSPGIAVALENSLLLQVWPISQNTGRQLITTGLVQRTQLQTVSATSGPNQGL